MTCYPLNRSGGSNGLRKVSHAQNQRSTSVKIVSWFVESGNCPGVYDIQQHGKHIFTVSKRGGDSLVIAVRAVG